MPAHRSSAIAPAPHSRGGVIGVVLLEMSLLALLAACASPAPPGDTGSPSEAGVTIVGTWLVGPDEVMDATPFLTIASDGSWTASDGCNVVRGTWKQASDGTLTTTSGPSTLIGCDGKPLPSLFVNATSATVDAGTLILQDETGEVVILVAGQEPRKQITTPSTTPTN